MQQDMEYYQTQAGRYPYYVIRKDSPELNLYGEPAAIQQGEDVKTQEAVLERFGVIQTDGSSVDCDVPMLVALEPGQRTLDKWGLDTKAEAVVTLSIAVCETMGLQPQVGDRFILVDPRSGRRVQYELMDPKPADYILNTGIPLHWVAAAKTCRSALPVDERPAPVPDYAGHLMEG
jgi:hypothetical protein